MIKNEDKTIFTFKDNVFNSIVVFVFVGSKRQLTKTIKETLKVSKRKAKNLIKDFNKNQGLTFVNGKNAVITINIDGTEDMKDTIVHEVRHVEQHILEYIGVTCDETKAYYNQALNKFGYNAYIEYCVGIVERKEAKKEAKKQRQKIKSLQEAADKDKASFENAVLGESKGNFESTNKTKRDRYF